MRKLIVVGWSVVAALSLALGAAATAAAQSVEQWGRFVVTATNPSFSGNPFELEVDATFTHASSGTTLTIPGYYAGNDQWKIAFMPTLLGTWNYVTSSRRLRPRQPERQRQCRADGPAPASSGPTRRIRANGGCPAGST